MAKVTHSVQFFRGSGGQKNEKSKAKAATIDLFFG